MKYIKPKCFGVDDAEKYSGLSKWFWRREAYASRVASYKVGKRLLIPVDEVDRVLTEGYRPALPDGDKVVR